MKNVLTFLILFLVSFQLIAQKGIIKGTIKDEKTGEEIIGANVIIA